MSEQLGPPDVDMSLGHPEFVFSKIRIDLCMSSDKTELFCLKNKIEFCLI